MPERKWFGIILAVVFFAGCTTTESLLDNRGKGQGETFVCTASYQRAYNAAVVTLKKGRFKILRKDKNKGYIVASDTIRLLNGGGRIAIFLYELGPSKTQVEVYSQPYFFIPSPTIYWAAHKRDVELRDAIRDTVLNS